MGKNSGEGIGRSMAMRHRVNKKMAGTRSASRLATKMRWVNGWRVTGSARRRHGFADKSISRDKTSLKWGGAKDHLSIRQQQSQSQKNIVLLNGRRLGLRTTACSNEPYLTSNLSHKGSSVCVPPSRGTRETNVYGNFVLLARLKVCCPGSGAAGR